MATKLTPYLLTIALAVGCACPIAAAQPPTAAEAPGRDVLFLSVHPERATYTLGEVVELEVRLFHRFGDTIVLPEAPGVENGRLQVYVATEEGPWKEYVGPRWGLEDVYGAPDFRLEAGKPYVTTARLLFNHHPDTDHLSPLYAAQVDRSHLATDYVFVQPGTYRIKAVADLGEEWGEVESTQVSLRVQPPRGPDLRVWEALRQDAELGYFVQTGGPKGHPLAERSRIQAAALLRLADEYPQAQQAAEISRSLVSYRATLRVLEARGQR